MELLVQFIPALEFAAQCQKLSIDFSYLKVFPFKPYPKTGVFRCYPGNMKWNINQKNVSFCVWQQFKVGINSGQSLD